MITIKPIGGSLGAEITGVDLRDSLDDSTLETLHQAFLDYQAVFFPGQDIGIGEMSAYVSRFGEPLVHPYLKSAEGYPGVHELSKSPDEKDTFGNTWHTDFTNLERPSKVNALYSVEVPTRGGDTLFMSTYSAYDALSPRLQAILCELDAVHCHSERYKRDLVAQKARKGSVTREDEDSEKYAAASDTVIHPVVRTHPETNRKSLYVNRGFTSHFDGMTEAESKPLLEFLFRHCENPDFGFRYRWEKGTLGIWDNRCTLHYATNDYHGERRTMYRMVVLEAERPTR